MTTNTTQPFAPRTQRDGSGDVRAQRALLLRVPRGEALVVSIILAVAAILRLVLALQGWPYVNSDEATIGLMVDDTLWHSAHPAFTYGEHHVGALDTYLQAPIFMAFGPTDLSLHITTTLQILLFLVVFYLFTRAIYSPLVAAVTIALLAIGPGEGLFYTLRAGAHAQDTLLLGALLLWLVVLRLRRPPGARVRLALNLGIGLVAGLGLWSTFLMVPFILAAALALGVEAYRSRKAAPGLARHRSLARQMMVMIAGLLIGMAPLIGSLILDHGIEFTEVVHASDGAGGPGAPGGLTGLLVRFGQQLAGTFLFGLPSMFGSRTICAGCPVWPSPQSSPPPGEELRQILIAAPISLLVITCWFLAANPLARDAWQRLRRTRLAELGRWRINSRLRACGPQSSPTRARMDQAPSREGGACEGRLGGGTPSGAVLTASRFDPRWWGRAMLVIGGGLTLLQYMATSSSYVYADTATRYIIGVYLCTPLVVAPLCQGAQHVWRWLRARARRNARPTRPRVIAWLASAVLLALFVVSIAGAGDAWGTSANRQIYGVPAGTRDTQVIAFLETHHATRFYTTWWVCYRLMFDSQENVDCYIVSNGDAFAPGNFNRVPAYAALVQAAPHPAYVFDLTTSEAHPNVPRQISQRIARGDPRFKGYTSAIVGGYIVFYYAGP